MSELSQREWQFRDSGPLQGVSLSPRQWVVVGCLIFIACTALPQLWQRYETFAPTPAYRVPYALSRDYWTYRRWTATLDQQGLIPLVGDSVIWGEYVLPHQTLAAALNQSANTPEFANAGLNGIHPLAMWGLLEHHTDWTSQLHVLVHCNLLWLTSAERDLSATEEQTFNHPDLVPQFSIDIPSYRQTTERRLSIVFDQRMPFRSWARHLRYVYWDGADLPRWTLDHPYANPLSQREPVLQRPDDVLRHRPISWEERNIPQQSFAWVDPESSLQWHGFQQSLRTLQQRGHRVLVLVGPFNLHLLTPESLARYRKIKRTIVAKLTQIGVPCVVPEVLPSEEYADASHPLAAGYARLATELRHHAVFQTWLKKPLAGSSNSGP